MKPPFLCSRRAPAVLLWFLLAAGLRAGGWAVLVPQADAAGRLLYYAVPARGEEVAPPRGEARRRVPAMDQEQFPLPESGCGPTAALNWMLWMENEGLFGPVRTGASSGPRARRVFAEIDREILALSGPRSGREGANLAELAVAMDRLVARRSGGAMRLHSAHFEAPLRVADLLEFTRGMRSGILITRVVSDLETRALGEFHAVSLVAGDRRGGLMINNWGERLYGTLRTLPDGQFFFPRDSAQPPLRIEAALCFVPIRLSAPLPDFEAP